MIEMNVKVNQYDAARLKGLLTFIAEHTRRNLPSLIKQACLTAINSAAIATKPGSDSKVSTLPRKFKLRPIVKMQSLHAHGQYFYKLSNGRIISSDQNWSNKLVKKYNIMRIVRAFKAWSKKLKRWTYLPYEGTKNTFDADAKGGKIPGYGAAKAGWLKAYNFFGKPDNSGDVKARRPVSRVTAQLSGSNPFAVIENLVEYVSITSPDSAQKGVNAAGHKIEKSVLPKLSGEIQAKWRN